MNNTVYIYSLEFSRWQIGFQNCMHRESLKKRPYETNIVHRAGIMPASLF
jgi:hypothetical protein